MPNTCMPGRTAVRIVATIAVLLAVMGAAAAADNWGVYADVDTDGDGHTDILQYRETIDPITYAVTEQGIYRMDGATQTWTAEPIIPAGDVKELHWLESPNGDRVRLVERDFGVEFISWWREQDGVWEQVDAPEPVTELFDCPAGPVTQGCWANPVVTWFDTAAPGPRTIAVWSDVTGFQWSTTREIFETGDCSSSAFDPRTHWRLCASLGQAWIAPRNANGELIVGTYRVQVYHAGAPASNVETRTFP